MVGKHPLVRSRGFEDHLLTLVRPALRRARRVGVGHVRRRPLRPAAARPARADPLTSITPKRFIFFLRAFICPRESRPSRAKLMLQQLLAHPELQLRLGHLHAFPVHRDIVAIGPLDQPVDFATSTPVFIRDRQLLPAQPMSLEWTAPSPAEKLKPTVRYPGTSTFAMFCAVSFSSIPERFRY